MILSLVVILSPVLILSTVVLTARSFRPQTGDAVAEERLQAGAAGGEAGTAGTLVRLQQTSREAEVKQHKQKDKHGKQHKQKTSSAKSRDGQPQPRAEKQRKVSGRDDEAGGPQLRPQTRQSSCESDHAGPLRSELQLPSPRPADDLSAESQQPPPSQPSDSPAESQHLQQVRRRWRRSVRRA